MPAQCRVDVAHGSLVPDFKTIADFRRDNGPGIRNVCRRFVVLCRDLKLFSQALVAIDGSKFKASNTRDRNFTTGKIDKRQQQIEESIQRYLRALETADRTQPAELEAKTTRLQEKIASVGCQGVARLGRRARVFVDRQLQRRLLADQLALIPGFPISSRFHDRLLHC
jgi:hypothetical protein